VLLLGGFSLSACLTRAKIKTRLAVLQWYLADSPRVFLLAVIFLSFGTASFVTNVTAPIALLPFVLPIARSLDSIKFAKALLLGLAFGCNVGGFSTPFSSPQNVIAFAALSQISPASLSFGGWMAVALPIGAACCVLVWTVLVVMFCNSDLSSVSISLRGHHGVRPQLPPLPRQALIGLVFCAAYVMACAFNSALPLSLGEPTIASLLLMTVLFGTGILTLSDFEAFPWHLIVLVGGGSVLGTCARASGLIDTSMKLAEPYLPTRPFLLVLCLALLALAISTIVSHTVSAIVLIPFIASVSLAAGVPASAILVCALCCSSAMALPFSSLPNISALVAESDAGTHFLTTTDFLWSGSLASIACATVSVLGGYWLTGGT
jgi:di/tricarboxylate transporter